ncbi:Inactive peptidyl-prolyl cis-trans isomerase FKBP6 [Nymphon striatum]|nr:Inactive peptidyl-prolyl cis-trans isomerase FKBP6 [Nymphon striatum]
MDSKNSSIPNIYDEEECPSLPLKSPLELDEFLKTKEAVFEADVNDDVREDCRYFDPKVVAKDLLENESGLDFSSDEDEDNALSPFENMMRKMTDISDGKKLVYKKVKKEGTDENIPVNATVLIHYNASAEYQDSPFDSTYLRNVPFKFRINNGDVLPGLNIAVSSMKLKEISYFIVKPEYAYGSMGCPPRIPPDAMILYKVQLMNIIDDADAEIYSQLNETEKENLSFERLCKFSNSELEKGNHFFKIRMYAKAKQCYGRMIDMLQNFRLKNDEEEIVQQQMLLKCYLNSSICALKLNRAPLVITMCSLALQIDQKNPKALFRKGKAYKMLMEFDKAKIFLEKAQLGTRSFTLLNRSQQSFLRQAKMLDGEQLRMKLLNSLKQNLLMALVLSTEFGGNYDILVKVTVDSPLCHMIPDSILSV